jgi:integrase
VSGFGCRVTGAGARSFVLNYRVKGQERRYTIGAYPDYSVTAAREEAKRLKQEIGKGVDPLAEKQADREAPTMADLAARYVEEHLPDKRQSSQGDDKSMIERDILPGLGRAKKVADVTGTDIKKLHRKVSERAPYRANRVLALLSKMFNLAMSDGWKMRSKQDGNPCDGIKRNQEVKRKRYLKPDELARLVGVLDALAESPDKQVANILRLSLFTGARIGEVLSMRWQYFDSDEKAWAGIDLEAGKWVKPGATTKQRTEHEVPLSAEALQLLRELRAGAGEDAEHVFPGDGATGHRVEYKKPWGAICKAAGLVVRVEKTRRDGTVVKDKRGQPVLVWKNTLRVHDLRHSYASFAISAGHGLPVVGALLGHTQASTTQRYAHLLDEPLRKATGQVGALVRGAGKRGAKVVKLMRRR